LFSIKCAFHWLFFYWCSDTKMFAKNLSNCDFMSIIFLITFLLTMLNRRPEIEAES